MGKGRRNNYKFEDSLIVNDATYIDFLNRFKRIALSMFEWINLPKSMNEEFLEKCLYYGGQATLLKSKKYVLKPGYVYEFVIAILMIFLNLENYIVD